MGRPRIANALLAAFLSWILATGLVAGVYLIWAYSQGEPVRWEFMRDATLIAIPFALFRAWRDRGRNQ